MTRREFLKHLGRLMTGAAILYAGNLLNIFQKNPSSSGATPHPAKFYRQADDLAG